MKVYVKMWTLEDHILSKREGTVSEVISTLPKKSKIMCMQVYKLVYTTSSYYAIWHAIASSLCCHVGHAEITILPIDNKYNTCIYLYICNLFSV